jgi:hypothetical protein
LITVRPSSVVERPGVYGAIPRIQGFGAGAGVMFVMAAGHSGRGGAVANLCAWGCGEGGIEPDDNPIRHPDESQDPEPRMSPLVPLGPYFRLDGGVVRTVRARQG